jgi:membrane protease YdiL (CAAX protease family)
MQYKSNLGYTGAGQFGLLLVFFGFGIVLSSLLTGLIGLQLIPSNVPFEKMGDAISLALKNTKETGWIRLIHLTNMVCLFGLSAFLFSRITNGKEAIWLGFSKHMNITQFFLAMMAVLAASIFSSAFKEITDRLLSGIPSLAAYAQTLEKSYDSSIQAIGRMDSVADLLIGLVLLAFVPAFFEELFFRGVLQRFFERWWGKPILAILVTSVIFSLLHLSVSYFITRTLLGFALGWIFYSTRNIWICIFAHGINNALALVSLYKSSFQTKLTQPEAMELRHDWWIVLLSLIALIFFLSRLKFFSEEPVFKIHTEEEKSKTRYSRAGDWVS